MENVGLDTKESNITDNKSIVDSKIHLSAKSLPNPKELTIFDSMATKHTIPEIKRGKEITDVPKGSTKRIEQAKQTWFIEFHHFHTPTGKMKRYRRTDDLNRIKDPKEKELHAQNICQMYKDLLEGDWSPYDEEHNDKLRRNSISLTIEEASTKFIQYNKDKGNRSKTIQSYESKLYFISNYFGERKVNEIQDNDAFNFLIAIEKANKWSPSTFNNARIVYYGLFEYLILEKYINENPFKNIKSKPVSKSDKHQVFSDKHLKLIMNSLAKDSYTDFFCKSIYYTCIRPKELRALQLKHIDLKAGIITVPHYISKNKKDGFVNIDPNYLKELKRLNLSDYPQDYYLTGCTKNIVGIKAVGENTPYNRFVAHLKKLELDKKNYTLYSFKHTSNVKKYIGGWTLAEIMKANRHASIEQTENYLKDLTKFVDISKKKVPTI